MRRILLTLLFTVLLSHSTFASIYNFTPAGATGQFGPTQAMADSYYGLGYVVVTGGIQNWTVPDTGFYRITAAGAQGASAQPGRQGGLGALLSGEFFFTAGQILQIAVGQTGIGAGSGSNGGGGGGSFVVDVADNPLLIAGGGGGTRVAAQQNGHSGQAGTVGTTSSLNSSTGGGVPKPAGTAGFGGTATAVSWGAAGAGFYSNGANDSSFGTGGSSWANGIIGGEGLSFGGVEAFGGFGGGGAGNGSAGGGGGGGYSGGDGGLVAGGGGSFNSGLNPIASTGVNALNGFVRIESLVLQSVPEPLSAIVWSFLIAGAIVVTRFHRK